MLTTKPQEKPFADDLLDGASDYAALLGWPIERVYHYLAQGRLPGGKVGSKWVGSKRAVVDHITNITSGRAA
jgi:hypothetical protein